MEEDCVGCPLPSTPEDENVLDSEMSDVLKAAVLGTGRVVMTFPPQLPSLCTSCPLLTLLCPRLCPAHSFVPSGVFIAYITKKVFSSVCPPLTPSLNHSTSRLVAEIFRRRAGHHHAGAQCGNTGRACGAQDDRGGLECAPLSPLA